MAYCFIFGPNRSVKKGGLRGEEIMLLCPAALRGKTCIGVRVFNPKADQLRFLSPQTRVNELASACHTPPADFRGSCSPLVGCGVDLVLV